MALISGGSSAFFNDAVAGTVIAVKNQGPTQITAVSLVNTTAAAAYLQIFNVPQSQVTLGTTIPAWTIRLLASAALTLPLDTPAALGGTGLSVAGTTTPTGSTGAAISVNLLYI